MASAESRGMDALNGGRTRKPSRPENPDHARYQDFSDGNTIWDRWEYFANKQFQKEQGD